MKSQAGYTDVNGLDYYYILVVMTTHSNILVWKVPWTEEPDGLQPMRSQRVGHNWVNNSKHHSRGMSFQYWRRWFLMSRWVTVQNWKGRTAVSSWSSDVIHNSRAKLCYKFHPLMRTPNLFCWKIEWCRCAFFRTKHPKIGAYSLFLCPSTPQPTICSSLVLWCPPICPCDLTPSSGLPLNFPMY